MRWQFALAPCLLGASAVVAAALSAYGGASVGASSPTFGVSIPDGHRRWELVATAHETDPRNELRAVLGNASAMRAYQEGTLRAAD